jgi:carbamoyl-phosphate synthase large subunit
VRRLIIGSAGGHNSFAIVKALRQWYGDSVFITAIDINPREQVTASLFSDAFMQVPPARSPEFGEALARLAETYSGSAYLPMHDEEIAVAARLASKGNLPASLELIAPSYDVVRLCLDKWRMHQWLKANGLPTPETVLATPEAIATVQLPTVLKPRIGTGSRGVRLIRERSELAGLASEAWLLQEFLQHPELQCTSFLSRHTGAHHSACHMFMGNRAGFLPAGHGPWRVFRDPVVETHAEHLARRLPIFGSFFFQNLSDESSRWLITDINPRAPAGRFTAAAGADFTMANLADFWGEPFDRMLQPIEGEYAIGREFIEYVVAAPAK